MSALTAYIYMASSVASEITATSTLPATKGFTKLKPSIVCIIGYIICFYCLGMSLEYLDLGVAYGTWGAVGTAITPALGYIFYKQKTSRLGLIGVVLIIIGVVMLNVYG